MEKRLPSVAWPKRRLDEIAEIRTGIAKGSKALNDPVAMPYLRVANVQAGSLDLATVKSILVSRRDISKYKLEPGDVLLTEGGDFDKLGRGTIWKGEIANCLHQNHVFVVRCERAHVLPEWVAWLAGSQYGRRYFLLCSKQSTNLASINSSQLSAFPIPLPPIHVQEKITRLMALFDARTASTERLIDAKRTAKRGLMQQLITGKRRFKEHETQPWCEVKLGDVFVERDETGRPDLRLLSVTSERGVIPRDHLDKRDTSNPDKSAYKRVAVGDIAYNTMRMWQGVSALSSLEGIVSPAYTVVVPTDRLDRQYAKHLFKLPSVVHRFFRHSQGLVDDTLNLKFDRFAKVRVTIPASVDEQRRIARALNACEEELGLLEQLEGRARLQKHAFLSRILSGELAISDASV